MNKINENQNTNPKIKTITTRLQFCPKKITTAITCAALGVLATLSVQHFTKKSRDHLVINHPLFFSDIAFAEDNLFDQMQEMEREINKTFAEHQKSMNRIFEEAKKNSDKNNTSNVSTSEDFENYIYQLDFSGFKKEDIVVSIKDNVVTFSAETKTTNDKNKKANSSISSFRYSFLAPQYDKKEPEIIRKDNQVLVKLPKKK